jgi:riboflavin biosynthesis pyrimidine reductase
VTELGVRLEPLLDESDGPPLALPDELEEALGGPLRLSDDVVYANFVASIDGVAAIEGIRMSSATISGGAAPDRLMMAVLRAAADAIVVGAGTLREHGGPWTAEKAFPSGTELFRRMREDAGKAEAPTLVVVTASGRLPADHAALDDAIVITTSAGVRTLADHGVHPGEVVDVGEADDVDSVAAIAQLRDRGHRRILTEGGPTLMGSMERAGVVDDLFLTVAPTVIGGGEGRPPFTDGADLLEPRRGARLIGVRRAADYLFLRYRLIPGETPPRTTGP